MTVLNVIWIVFQVLIGYNLVLPIFLYLLYSIKKKPQLTPLEPAEADYAIIVTAYEWVGSIPEVVNSLLALDHSNYLIYVVADKCDISGLHFDDERVIILRPEETLAGNVRSHFYAIQRFKRPHERLTIIDSDNMVDPSYLTELDKMFAQGFKAVQGIREAKNLDTTYACLDGARDIYYHFYDGKVLFGVGSSATLAGSGMAFTTALYRQCLEGRDVSGAGFDKVLQAAILNQDKRIAFAEKAVVYDEKTTHSEQLVKQRARWINTWFKYFKYGFTLVGRSVGNFSLNQFLFGLILLRPPLFIFLILAVFCMLANVFINAWGVVLWLAGFVLFVLGFYLALAKSPTDARIWRSLVNIPKFIYFQVLSLLKVRKANQHSVATRGSADPVPPNNNNER
ncbi:glycosyltransferase family 2 protein [Mucilaginibacter daejeonensis]|uniref:glycosyltransferase n=1 Tax=Mucilaginibacter daejeonensis TaxID=398049 RepID=UPI001D170BDF|nr:glycosyltransferase [Mucilaginibacter daejeonensis]UEG53828.1 glycosyltransferase family 2 protein [Mucilaginibacter daejeonensis]